MELILKTLGAEVVFDNNGDLTTDGHNAYEKLIVILDELYRIGATDKTVDEFESYFDEIFRLGF